MARRPRRPSDPHTGVGAVVDPTKNVLDLVEAAVMRIDDMAALRSQLQDEQIKRMEREWVHLEAMAALRELHAKEMRDSEAKRLDAIRENDRTTIATTAAAAATQITALATSGAVTAETLRNNTERTVSPILDRLTSIETTVNRGIGRSAVADPQLSELMIEMRKLSTSRDVGAGKSEGFDKSWAIVLAVVALLWGFYTFANRPQPALPTPQVIYSVAPPGTLLPTTPPAQVPR